MRLTAPLRVLPQQAAIDNMKMSKLLRDSVADDSGTAAAVVQAEKDPLEFV
jgi:hypothetical protein